MSTTDILRQLSLLIGLPTLWIMGGAAAILVVARDWRLTVLGYAVMASMAGLLLCQVIPVEWALLQPIVGGLNAIVVFLSARQLRWAGRDAASWEVRWPQLASVGSFRVLTVAVAVVAFFALRDQVQLPKVSPLLRDAVVWLVMIGLLGIALHEEPLHAGLSLLTVLVGFQILLFSLILDRLWIGLTHGGQLLLGLAIAYLTVARGFATPVRGEGGRS